MDKIMSILNSLTQNIKSIFASPNKKKKYINPLDTMPIATDDAKYSSRHESTPDYEKSAEEIVTMHEKMYRMATAKYNPFAIGGSESIHDFEGGSENVQKI
tara:strand:- start:327 stop:629 length:303 start_codon:yes stop_codon:yes gene_type:complete